ncbi:MAG: AMP-binding protein [Limimaricola sp.]|uniref:AMP-binding protein n=1 Tax=Limimaricola sp. TaxID=2211665 RepID=UPI001DCE361E|nr:class I adenylate-forming enzyme family protein [Limimaricola sp.]MBI1416258.1 AMP-binding protein [Limimaricola sp.]
MQALARHANAPALLTRDGQTVSHSRLRRNIGILAQRMAAVGLAPGDRMIAQVDNRDLQIMARFAALLLGAEVVMAPDASGFLASGGTVDWSLVFPGQSPGPGRPITFSPNWFADDAPAPPEDWPGGGGMIFGSSGSTGLQKFMLASDSVLASWQRRARTAIGPDFGNRLLGIPAFSVFGLIYLSKALIEGHAAMGTMGDTVATMVAARNFDVRELVGTPLILNDVTEAAEAGHPMPAFARFLFGGAIADNQTLARTAAAFAGAHLDVVVGSSEYSISTLGRVQERAIPLGWVGWPVPDTELRLDSAGAYTGYPAAAGRLSIRVPEDSRVTGYLNGAPAFDPEGWFDTGDIATIASDGSLVIHGREDFLINLGGIKTTPESIEALCLAHPGVAQVAATRIPGQAHDRLGLLVAVGPGFDADRLRAALAARLDLALAIEVREVEALPRLPTGKIDRAAVARLFA